MATRKKSWKELMSAIRATFRKWHISTWEIVPEEPPGRRDEYHSVAQRAITVRFSWNRKTIVLRCDETGVAHDNLGLLSSALEAMRVGWAQGYGYLLVDAYQQMYPTVTIKVNEPKIDPSDPYAVLGVGHHYPLAVIEAIWKARLRVEHPDVGGNIGVATKLNSAMAEIRKRKG